MAQENAQMDQENAQRAKAVEEVRRATKLIREQRRKLNAMYDELEPHFSGALTSADKERLEKKAQELADLQSVLEEKFAEHRQEGACGSAYLKERIRAEQFKQARLRPRIRQLERDSLRQEDRSAQELSRIRSNLERGIIAETSATKSPFERQPLSQNPAGSNGTSKRFFKYAGITTLVAGGVGTVGVLAFAWRKFKNQSDYDDDSKQSFMQVLLGMFKRSK